MYFTLGLSQEANLKDLYSKKEYNKAIKLAQTTLISSPEDFDTQLILLKIYNSKSDYSAARVLLTKLSSSDQKFLTESLKTNYGLGNKKEVKRIYDQLIKDSKNEVLKKELLKFGLVTGLDPIYDDWKIKEAQNIVFHFQQSIPVEKMQNIVACSRIVVSYISYFLLKGNIIYRNILFLVYLLFVFCERQLFINVKNYIKR
ncbi:MULTISPECIES: tetratricopeptide repeat protein [unclassified Chryseobacterium]|uniref:tetratricopeptide repeat protein n=1 Tax=unclassified Chryseobacterium TaxID=2593645 RepID=UPI00300FA3BE